jgi:hypothetical protein
LTSRNRNRELFVGHYSASFAGRAIERRIPLWLLFIAVQSVDVLWAIFVLLGIEKVRIVPGFTASNPLDLYYMPYTHSLVGAIGWSVLAFLICQSVPRLRGGRTGTIVALAVFSHWILDLIVHRPDLALYDNAYKMGFGLWNYRWPAFILEIALLIGGAALYLKSTLHKGRLIGFVVVLVLVQWAGTFLLPPPSSGRAEAITALVFYFLLAAVAGWAEKGVETRNALAFIRFGIY